MWNAAVIGPGFKAVPDVEGGAIEHLTTVLLNENECYHKFHFDVYTLSHPLLDEKQYKYSKLIQVKNYQKFFPIRIIFSIINRTCRLFRIKKNYHYMSCILPYMMRNKYDFILVENNIEVFFRLRNRFPDTKIVFHIHNDYDTVDIDYDKTKKRVIELEKRADMILTASYYLKRHICTITAPDKIHVLENCIDKRRYVMTELIEKRSKKFRTKNGITDKHFVVMFCGRFDKWKGALELLQSIEQMNENSNVKILLVGSMWFHSKEEIKYLGEIEKKVEELKDQIICCGYISQEKIQEIYAATDVVAIPSQLEEAFGMTALEAISMGKPCVASACGGLLDILDENCAKLIPRGRGYVRQFAQALDELNKDRVQLKRLAEGAVEKSQRFSDREEYYKLFVKLIEKHLFN